MSLVKLKQTFDNASKVIIKKDVLSTFAEVRQKTKPEDSISIVGTHYFGPYISKFFKICFDKI